MYEKEYIRIEWTTQTIMTCNAKDELIAVRPLSSDGVIEIASLPEEEKRERVWLPTEKGKSWTSDAAAGRPDTVTHTERAL